MWSNNMLYNLHLYLLFTVSPLHILKYKLHKEGKNLYVLFTDVCLPSLSKIVEAQILVEIMNS